MNAFCLFPLVAAAALTAGAAVPALDLSDPAQRAKMPRARQISLETDVTQALVPNDGWGFRFHVTKSWTGELPQWPSVNLPVAVKDWRAYDRLVIDFFNDAPGGDSIATFICGPTGAVQHGLSASCPLADFGLARWTIPLKKWHEKQDPANVGRIHLFMTTPSAADLRLAGFYLLKAGEEPPAVSEKFIRTVVEPGKAKAERLRKERRAAALKNFLDACRAAGQKGDPAWIGKATSMEKIRPRDGFKAAAADAFSLRLARGEYESLQVLACPNGRDLGNVRVTVGALRRVRRSFGDWLRGRDEIPAAAFKTSPMGYVETVNPAPYRSGYNVATNLPGGYYRQTGTTPRGWWPDPILDYLDRADVKDGDVQSFWVRCKCPRDQRAGLYEGTLAVCGEGWEKTFPFTVRVYDFEVPVKSPLPLAITFSPEASQQFADAQQLALVKSLREDKLSPLNQWEKHLLEWGDFLADHYITMDSLYHNGSAVKWDVLARLKEQGRLGLFNLGYWGYPRDLSEATKASWRKGQLGRIRPVYEKAKKLGLLDHAYLYGCDEVHTQYFGNIQWALAELKREFPEVPRFTTAYDHNYGVGSALKDMNWFCPTTYMYGPTAATNIPASRAEGHKVWWYIACGPHAPYANMFVEYQAIEGRQLMGAQTVKYRPEGFLYYQISIWNARRPIDGPSTFTDWEPRSWTRYHGDGSWFCCGPDGRPCETIRMENFRDGLEDYAYALEYERVTGKPCTVPEAVCRDCKQFTDDPAVYYAWRDAIAEAIEEARLAK